MQSSRIVLAAMALTFATGLAACGDDDDSDTSATTAESGSATTEGGSSGGSVSAEAYMTTVCTATTQFGEAGTALQESLQSSAENLEDAEAGKSVVVAAFESFEQATNTAADAIDGAGVPDVPNGEQLAEGLSSNFAELRTAVGQLVEDARELPTDSPASFQDGVDQITEEFATALDAIGSNELDSPELDEASKQVEACEAFR